MSVVERTRPRTHGLAERATRLRWGLAVSVLLAVSLGLRLWGAGHGLPYAYNADENAHFVPKAIGLFGHGWDPDYFVNPPAYTYVLHLVFGAWFGGRTGVSQTFAEHPGDVFLVARIVAALLGTAAVWLLYLTGARLFDDRRAGFLAAALLGVAFLPVFYAHLALNDVPTLAPIALSLYGTAGIVRHGRLGDYALAGVALGFACAFKYTGGIALLPLLAAALNRLTRESGAGGAGGRDLWRALAGLALAAVTALAGFLALNPYALLDFAAFRDGLQHQTEAAGDDVGKLGLTENSGIVYYLWTFTWGLGWVPLVAAAGGAVALAVRRPWLAAVLVPAPVLFLLFMGGTQERFFGRWLLPVFPLVCLLAGAGVVLLADALGRRVRVLGIVALGVAAAALVAQGVITSVHLGGVLSRADTRNLARAWMVDHVPAGTKVVIEPVVPDGWAQDIGRPFKDIGNGNRWRKFPTSRSNIANDGRVLPGEGRIVNIEDYERTLYPGLIDRYTEKGFCWVVVGSTQRGRAEADPEQAPRALAYYRELERRSDTAYVASPYHAGAEPVPFNFDWSFDFYPSAYERPGPTMWVYHLRGRGC